MSAKRGFRPTPSYAEYASGKDAVMDWILMNEANDIGCG